MIKIHEVEQGSEAWHELRNGKYTGSNAHKLLRFGTIPYARAAQTSFKGTYHTKRGQALEPEAVELYERITGRSVLRPGFCTNSKYPNCGYSPDGIDGGILIEVKCFSKDRHLAIYKGEIPVEVLAQVHFGLLICGLKEARLIIYNPEFAKKTIMVDGYEIPNPDYNPKLALKIITIRSNRDIQSNMRRILTKEQPHAVHPQTA